MVESVGLRGDEGVRGRLLSSMLTKKGTVVLGMGWGQKKVQKRGFSVSFFFLFTYQLTLVVIQTHVDQRKE